MTADEIVAAPFLSLGDVLRTQARRRGAAIALADETQSITWAALDVMLDRIGAALQRGGAAPHEPVAIAAANSVPAALAFLGALRAGCVPAPLTSSATAQTLLASLADSGSRFLFVDADVSATLAGHDLPPPGVTRIALEAGASGLPLDQWLAPEGAVPAERPVASEDPFNIIYSSGTTGTPKGIVQSHAMRHEYARRALARGLGDDTVAIASTPLYSNTTLVVLLPTLAVGGKVVLMKKFDARRFLELSERERVTSAMLVPVQFRRIMELPDFDRFDLSSFKVKMSTSAPFPASLKAEVLARWPGGLIDAYGMTEGGANATLFAHLNPDKLHTVGQVNPGHTIKIIDEDGNELPAGAAGEIVGRSPLMMTGYHGLPDKTREAEWYDADGNRYIRHGDIGRFDEDGFLILIDRSKDLIISGGFNIYPADLEARLTEQPAVREAAVIGVPSETWGETPLAVVVLDDAEADPQAILNHANERLGRTQRISGIRVVDELPRSQIGKVLKRELRDRFAAAPPQATAHSGRG